MGKLSVFLILNQLMITAHSKRNGENKYQIQDLVNKQVKTYFRFFRDIGFDQLGEKEEFYQSYYGMQNIIIVN